MSRSLIAVQWPRHLPQSTLAQRYEIVSIRTTADARRSRTVTTVTSLPSRRLCAAALAVGLATLLGGCSAPLTLTPVATPESSSAPSSPPAVEVIDEPVSGLDLRCSDLLTESQLYQALGVATALVDPLQSNDNVTVDEVSRPNDFAMQAAGGIECRWSNGQPSFIDGDSGPSGNPSYAAVTVDVLPDSASEQDLYRQSYEGLAEGDSLSCYETQSSGIIVRCGGESFIRSTWVTFGLVAPLSGDRADATAQTELTQPLWSSVISTVAGAAAQTNRYSPALDLVELEFSCYQFVSTSEARSVLAISEEPFLDQSDGGWSLRYSADRMAKSFYCYWYVGDYFEGVGVVNTYLSGGGWALDEVMAESPQAFEPVDLTGLAPGDAAYLDCSTSARCNLHLDIGFSWIMFERVKADDPGAVPIDRRTLIRLGELTVANLRG